MPRTRGLVRAHPLASTDSRAELRRVLRKRRCKARKRIGSIREAVTAGREHDRLERAHRRSPAAAGPVHRGALGSVTRRATCRASSGCASGCRSRAGAGCAAATMPRVPVIALVDGEHHPAARPGGARPPRPRRRRLLRRRGEARRRRARTSTTEARWRPAPRRRCGGWRPVPTRSSTSPTSRSSAAARQAAPRGARPAPRPALRGARPAARPAAYEPVAFDGPKLAVIGTGKRTGKTAVAGHSAGLLRERARSGDRVHGTRGPAEPRLAAAEHVARRPARDRRPRRARRLRLPGGRGARRACTPSAAGAWAAASPARPPSRTCRRAPPWPRGSSRADRVRGLRRVHPSGRGGPHGLRARCGRARAVRRVPAAARRSRARGRRARPRRAAGRAAVPAPRPSRPSRCPERRAGGALHHRRARGATGSSRSWPRPTSPAARHWPTTSSAPSPSGCDVYLTELKAAAIDTVARRARAEGARVVFVRNRPVGDGLDEALVKLYDDAG